MEILKYRMEGNPFVSGMGPLQRHVSQRYDNWFSQKCETVYISDERAWRLRIM